jgi:hypothetical protein
MPSTGQGQTKIRSIDKTRYKVVRRRWLSWFGINKTYNRTYKPIKLTMPTSPRASLTMSFEKGSSWTRSCYSLTERSHLCLTWFSSVSSPPRSCTFSFQIMKHMQTKHVWLWHSPKDPKVSASHVSFSTHFNMTHRKITPRTCNNHLCRHCRNLHVSWLHVHSYENGRPSLKLATLQRISCPCAFHCHNGVGVWHCFEGARCGPRASGHCETQWGNLPHGLHPAGALGRCVGRILFPQGHHSGDTARAITKSTFQFYNTTDSNTSENVRALLVRTGG